ncbi:MAG: DUF6088 family protein [Elusimicrobiota bacterium]|nr:DUF6088 family protein [Elusimicrobiota bacterium]
MGKHTNSIDGRILSRIKGKGRGSVFTPADFLDLGSRAAVDQALSRGTRGGAIRKLVRGLYDYPRRHPSLGTLAPSTDAIAKAIQGRDASRLQPSGAQAANMLGLSEQVPARAVFLTDGRSRKVQLGKRLIILKRTTPRQMATAGRISGTVIQALHWLGRRQEDDRAIAILRRQLSARDKRQLLNDIPYAPAWIGELMRRIAEPPAR